SFFYGSATYRIADHYSIAIAVDVLASVPASKAKLHARDAEAAAFLDLDRPQRTEGPTVSIIMRTIDRHDYLRRALASVAAQTYRNIEIVLVCNGALEVP